MHNKTRAPHTWFLDAYDLDVKFESEMQFQEFLSAVKRDRIFSFVPRPGCADFERYPGRKVYKYKMSLRVQLFTRTSVDFDFVIQTKTEEKKAFTDFDVNSFHIQLKEACKIPNLDRRSFVHFQTQTCELVGKPDHDIASILPKRLVKMLQEGWKVNNLLVPVYLEEEEKKGDQKLCWDFVSGHTTKSLPEIFVTSSNDYFVSCPICNTDFELLS